MKEVTCFITRAASTYLQILTFSYLGLGPAGIDIIVLFLFFLFFFLCFCQPYPGLRNSKSAFVILKFSQYGGLNCPYQSAYGHQVWYDCNSPY